jgi:hypothetical protein
VSENSDVMTKKNYRTAQDRACFIDIEEKIQDYDPGRS